MSKRSLPTDVPYSTSEAGLQFQPSAIELELARHILQVVVFLFCHLCKYTSTCTPFMHTNTVEIRTVLLSVVNVSMQQLTFVSSLGLSKFCATCREKWDMPDLELFYARVSLLPNLLIIGIYNKKLGLVTAAPTFIVDLFRDLKIAIETVVTVTWWSSSL